MYHYLVGITFIKSFIPYIRKHLLNVLETHELIFINTIVYTVIVFMVFLYSSKSEKRFHNYKKLDYTHGICIILIALVSIASTLFMYEFDKKYNTPFLNSIFRMAASAILLFCTGVFFFNETYTMKHIFGVILMMSGAYLTTQSD